MKKAVFGIAFIVITGWMSCKNESKDDKSQIEQKTQTESKQAVSAKAKFGVRGNCSMCKNTIELAAKAVKGVNEANWDKDKKEIFVSFNSSQTNLESIHKAIAISGYDTDKILAKQESYKKLPMCCKYDQKKMKVSVNDN
ncbi:MAG: heavy-metal-associated domain-containing protein [Tenacibaculum sp.]